MSEMRMKRAATAKTKQKRREPASLRGLLDSSCCSGHGFAAKSVKIFYCFYAHQGKSPASGIANHHLAKVWEPRSNLI